VFPKDNVSLVELGYSGKRHILAVEEKIILDHAQHAA